MNRRTFFKKSALLSGSALITPSVALKTIEKTQLPHWDMLSKSGDITTYYWTGTPETCPYQSSYPHNYKVEYPESLSIF